MRNSKKGFTLIELLIVVVIVGILALAAIPLITSNTRDARRAEGEQLLSSARNFARVEYSKVGEWAAPATTNFADEVTDGSFSGQYYQVTNLSGATVDGAIINADPTTAADGTAHMAFRWNSGQSAIDFGTAPAIPGAP